MSINQTCLQYVKTPSKLDGYLDFFQMASGVVLVLFMWAHMLFVSSILIHRKLFDALAWLFEVTYMAQLGAVIIGFIIISHFVLAARKMPFKSTEHRTYINHAKLISHKETWMWLIQVISAMIILVMGLAHIWVVMSTPAAADTHQIITSNASAYRVQNGWFLYYIVLLLMVELHVSIGFFRIGVKWGFIKRDCRKFWQRVEVWMFSGFVVLGVLSLLKLYFLKILV